MPQYIVKPGDCLSSIAATFGLPWQTIWNDPNNAALKAKRQDPNVLFPGDILFMPDKQPVTLQHASDTPHGFVLKGAITYLRLQILDWDQPRAYELYVLKVGSLSLQGQTDGSGYLEVQIPAKAMSAQLLLGTSPEVIAIDLGKLDPISEVSGKMGRLNNLGYACPIDGTMNDRATEAILLFQTDANVPATGVMDSATEAKIKQLHGR